MSKLPLNEENWDKTLEIGGYLKEVERDVEKAFNMKTCLKCRKLINDYELICPHCGKIFLL